MGQEVAVAGRDRDCTGERGTEVARLSPAHLPPAGAEVSEVLMSLVLISQQQQMLSEQEDEEDNTRWAEGALQRADYCVPQPCISAPPGMPSQL